MIEFYKDILMRFQYYILKIHPLYRTDPSTFELIGDRVTKTCNPQFVRFESAERAMAELQSLIIQIPIHIKF